MADFELPDYSHLGIDIIVEPDLDEDERLAVDEECVLQDLVHMWTQPTGISDGTVQGAQWGIDLRSYLNTGQTPSSLFALKNSLEVQATRDDRISACQVALTLTAGVLRLDGSIYVGSQPYPFSFVCSQSTVGDLLLERLPDGV